MFRVFPDAVGSLKGPLKGSVRVVEDAFENLRLGIALRVRFRA